MSFSHSEEIKLINIVEKHPILYDLGCSEYHDFVEKENVWKSIGEELNKTSDDCKKKWKFVRDSYIRFKKRSRPGYIAPKHAKHNRHSQLSFLDKHKTRGLKFATSPAIETENTKDTNKKNYEEINVSERLVLHDEDMLNTNIPEVINIKQELSDDELSELPIQIRKHSRQKDANSHNKLKVRKRKNRKRKRFPKKSNDDVELFCAHIAQVLRNLPPVYKAEAKKEIGVMISDYEIKAARSQPNPSFRYVPTEDCNDNTTTSASSTSEYSTN